MGWLFGVKFYYQLGQIQEITDILQPHHYLPHQCGVKTVFAQKSKSSSMWQLKLIFTFRSMTYCWWLSPFTRNFATLLRFKWPKYVITANIDRMYCQIELRSTDRKLQLVLSKPGREKLVILQDIGHESPLNMLRVQAEPKLHSNWYIVLTEGVESGLFCQHYRLYSQYSKCYG